jgi:starch synthase (maltosyl-transferring)
MKRLAKLGFSQSYTYFAWRTAKWELEEYLRELTRTEMADYFRPCFWPNTPDILTEQLQHGDRRTFMMRAVLAGTLAASWGMYGPVFELAENRPRHAGSEEYLDGEKYEIRQYDLDDPMSIASFIADLNAIRGQQLALQHNQTLEFHGVDNDALIAYSKTAPGAGGQNVTGPVADHTAAPLLMIVNLEAQHRQSGWVDVRLDVLGLDERTPYVVHDLLTDVRYEWRGSRNFVILDPDVTPAHVLRIEPAQPAPPADQGSTE